MELNEDLINVCMYGRPADYRILNIGGKSVYVFKDHATAILAWYYEKKDTPLNLITFDEHTDTWMPLRSYRNTCLDYSESRLIEELEILKSNLSGEVLKRLLRKGGYLKAPIGKREPPEGFALELRNAEHISTGCYLDIINKAYICCHTDDCQIRELTSPGLVQIYQNRIIYLSEAFQNYYPPNTTKIEELICEVNFRKDRNIFDSKIAQLINAGLNITPPYILDIDLDYFHDLNVLEQPYTTYKVFGELCRNATCITIATEPYWVRCSCENFNRSISAYNNYIKNNKEICSPLAHQKERTWKSSDVLSRLLNIIEYSLTHTTP